jgi:hypothetical protein
MSNKRVANSEAAIVALVQATTQHTNSFGYKCHNTIYTYMLAVAQIRRNNAYIYMYIHVYTIVCMPEVVQIVGAAAAAVW